MKKPGQGLSQKRGFTLLEISVALGIGSLILVVIYQAFFLAMKETRAFKSSINRHEEVYYALDYVEEEILGCQEIWQINGNGQGQVILVQTRPRSPKYKGHFICYKLDANGQLFRYAWYNQVTRIEKFSYDNAPGKNRLARNIEKFNLDLLDEGISIKLTTKEGRSFERFLARRCPYKKS